MQYLKSHGLLVLSLLFFCATAYITVPRFLFQKSVRDFSKDLAACITTNTNNPMELSGCMQRVVVELVHNDTPEAVVQKLRLVGTDGTVGSRCHQVGHYVGISLLEKNGGDLEAVLNACSGLNCGNGCAHGAIISSFGLIDGNSTKVQDIPSDPVELLPIAEMYCARDNPLCHAMGHAFAMTFTDSTQSQKLCDEISGLPVKRSECYTGMFMEYAQTGNSFAHVNKPITKTDYSCDTVTGPARYSCLRYVSAHVFSQCRAGGAPRNSCLTETERACSALNETDSAACFFGLGNNNNDAGLCGRLSGDQAFYCTLGMAFSFKNKNRKDLSYCSTFTDARQKERCTELYTHMLQGLDDAEAETE